MSGQVLKRRQDEALERLRSMIRHPGVDGIAKGPHYVGVAAVMGRSHDRVEPGAAAALRIAPLDARDPEANALLTRNYRAPYIVPAKV